MDWFRRYADWLHLQWPVSRPELLPRRGKWRWSAYLSCVLFLAFCFFLYNWKNPNGIVHWFALFEEHGWFPFNIEVLIESLSDVLDGWASTRENILFTVRGSMAHPNFYYTLVYSTCVLIFGLRRMRRRPTAYIRTQTWTLIGIQIFFLFLLPEILLPWAGNCGWFLQGTVGGDWANLLFEMKDEWGYDRAYWRAYGFVLAWPLFLWNVFTDHPMWAWLVICLFQTFVVIPYLVWRWGKGAYCGWICSCGALAETLGDEHRHKMPHGKNWNRLNLLGQVVLLFVLVLFALRVASWFWPMGTIALLYLWLLKEMPLFNYSWFVDIFLSGILGVGLYFWFSGRTWCRFACPLAGLMHIYARFSRFRILSKKEHCTECGECTAACHQGIDVMGFAKIGRPMEDPQCVRCSSCIYECSSGVLSFAEVDRKTGKVIHSPRLQTALPK